MPIKWIFSNVPVVTHLILFPLLFLLCTQIYPLPLLGSSDHPVVSCSLSPNHRVSPTMSEYIFGHYNSANWDGFPGFFASYPRNDCCFTSNICVFRTLPKSFLKIWIFLFSVLPNQTNQNPRSNSVMHPVVLYAWRAQHFAADVTRSLPSATTTSCQLETNVRRLYREPKNASPTTKPNTYYR